MVSSSLDFNRLQVHINTVLVFPPNESSNIKVNLESRNGTWTAFWDRDVMQWPKVVKLLLIFFVS